MVDAIFQSTTIPVLEQALQFAQARHTVLAGNIANLDTPGYRARDLSEADFQSRLKEAIRRRHEPTHPVSPGDAEPPARPMLASVAADSTTILRHDGAKVGIEHEVTEMVKNQLKHNLAVAVIASQFRLLQAAISEKV